MPKQNRSSLNLTECLGDVCILTVITIRHDKSLEGHDMSVVIKYILQMAGQKRAAAMYMHRLRDVSKGIEVSKGPASLLIDSKMTRL